MALQDKFILQVSITWDWWHLLFYFYEALTKLRCSRKESLISLKLKEEMTYGVTVLRAVPFAPDTLGLAYEEAGPALFGAEYSGGWFTQTEESLSCWNNFYLIPLCFTVKTFCRLESCAQLWCLPWSIWLADTTSRVLFPKEICDLLFFTTFTPCRA